MNDGLGFARLVLGGLDEWAYRRGLVPSGGEVAAGGFEVVVTLDFFGDLFLSERVSYREDFEDVDFAFAGVALEDQVVQTGLVSEGVVLLLLLGALRVRRPARARQVVDRRAS